MNIKFYKLIDSDDYLIMKSTMTSNRGFGKRIENIYYYSNGNEWRRLDDPNNSLVPVTDEFKFKFTTRNYLGNGLVKLDEKYILNLNSGEITNRSKFMRNITLKSGDIFQLYREESGDILLIKNGTTIGCNIKPSRHCGGYFQHWRINRGFHKIDEVNIDIECFGNRLHINSSGPAIDCIVDLTNKKFITGRPDPIELTIDLKSKLKNKETMSGWDTSSINSIFDSFRII